MGSQNIFLTVFKLFAPPNPTADKIYVCLQRMKGLSETENSIRLRLHLKIGAILNIYVTYVCMYVMQ